MDTDAARRARQNTIKADLAEAFTDEEACPPEWVDLLSRTTTERVAIAETVEKATVAFVNEPDIRRALRDRERLAAKIRERVAKLNADVMRMNLLVPHSRFTRAGLDAEETLRPLFNSRRAAG
jgi:hypothetical protein